MQTRVADEDAIYLASGGYDHTLRFWIPHEGKCSKAIQHPNSQVNDIKISPNKADLAVASFQHIRIYNIPTVQNHNPETNLEGCGKNVLSIGFKENSKELYSGGEDQITRIWDLKASKDQSQLMRKSDSPVNSVKMNLSQTKLYIGLQSGQIEIWDFRHDNVAKLQLPQHNSSVQCLSLNPMHDLLAAIDNTGHCYIFSPNHQLTPYCMWKAHSSYGLKCLFSPNGVYLVTTSADHTAKIWKTCDFYDKELVSAQPPTPFKVLTCDNQRWVWDVAFSADSQFLFTGSSDSVVRLWHVESAEMRREYTGHQKAVTAIAFSDSA